MMSHDIFEILNTKKTNHCVHRFYILFYDVKLCISLLLVLFFESHWKFTLDLVDLPNMLIINTNAGELWTPAALSYFLCDRKLDSQT